MACKNFSTSKIFLFSLIFRSIVSFFFLRVFFVPTLIIFKGWYLSRDERNYFVQYCKLILRDATMSRPIGFVEAWSLLEWEADRAIWMVVLGEEIGWGLIWTNQISMGGTLSKIAADRPISLPKWDGLLMKGQIARFDWLLF